MKPEPNQKEGKKNEESCRAWAEGPEPNQTSALQFAFIGKEVTPMNKLCRSIGNRKKNATKNQSQKRKQARNELMLLGNPAKRFNFEDQLRAEAEALGKGTVQG